jgi:hypothetical protein
MVTSFKEDLQGNSISSNFQIRVSTQFTLNGRAGEKRAFI